jgi:hypothetical protein
MSRIIGDRTKKSALDEMEEVARARNKDVAEEERLDAERKQKENAVSEEKSKSTAITDITSEFICIDNITCIDADGIVREHYPKLYVRKEVEAKLDEWGLNHQFDISGAEEYLKNKKMFNPSFALHCNILNIFWQNREDKEIAGILEQYLKAGEVCNIYKPNTLVDYARQLIINYPYASDFPSYKGNSNINEGRRIELGFSKAGLINMNLEHVLCYSIALRFLKQLTCMEHPEVFLEMKKLCNKNPYLTIARRTPMSEDASDFDEVTSTSIGTNNFLICLDVSNYINESNRIRGVCEVKPQ